MPRLTETNMTAAERAAFQRLTQAVGFAPKVMYGRDRSAADHLLARVTNGAVLYAIAVNGTPTKNAVTEYRLLIAPVATSAEKNTAIRAGTSGHGGTLARELARRRHLSVGVSKSWAARRAKYGPPGRRWFKKPAGTPDTAA